MLSRQNKVVIGTGVFFLILAALVLYQPEPDLVASPLLLEQIDEADIEVRRRKAGTSALTVEAVGRSLSDWVSESPDLTDEQRSDLSLLARDARMLAAGMSGQGLELADDSAERWVGLRKRIEATLAGK